MHLSRRVRVIAGAASGVLLVGGVTGGALASHSSSSPSQATSATPSPSALASPTATPRPKRKGAAKVAGVEVSGKLESVTGQTLTFVDPSGTAHTVAVTKKTKVTGPSGGENPSAIPIGDVVVIDEGPPKGSSASAAGAAGSAPATTGAIPVALQVTDTGVAGR